MKQLLKILQVFGLFPFIRAGHQLVVSRSLMVYFISVVLMNLTLHVNAVVSITSGVLTEKLDLFSMVSLLLDDMFFGLCVTASLSMLFAWTREIRSILNELLETEKLLECRLKSVPFSTLKLLILLLLCLFKFYESCCYYRLNLNVVPFAYLILMTYLILIDQYFVALIHMNRYLHGIINLKLRLLDKKTALASSRCLRTRHFHLSCLYDKINDCFSVCNLISISVCFIEGIFSVCVFTFADQPWASAFLSSVTWFFYFFKLVTVIEACNNCYREADQTAQFLHEVLVENDDPEIREELEIFSLQLLHRKVNFNACGFFKLDFTLVYSMLGAVTTYIVILMQFQEAEDPMTVLCNCTDEVSQHGD